ncbi:MAG: glycoside hydrolase family 10 [Clostridiales bacterium]|nr:glycoside hydrolase family 10 [Clostridiales bacterium]
MKQMSDRRKILDLFEEQNDFINAKVANGIEHYRKGNAKLKVTDKDGNSIPDAKIKACQKTHEFRFGANIFMLDELETETKNEAYKKAFSDVFNMATIPFYWNALEPEREKTRYTKDSLKIYRRPAPDLCIEFCQQHGIEPREHALAYDRAFPKWLYDASVEEIKDELERRYAEIAERYADKIHTIEVTNEMEWETGKTKFYDEPDFVEWCFKLAEKYFPNNHLAINEYTGLCWEDRCRATDKYYSYIEANMLKGARIDAIGMQFHLFNRLESEYGRTRLTLNPKNLYKHMDLYSNLGKPLQITEVTIPSYSWEAEDEQIQAEIIEKLYSIWFSHQNVEQIIYWNLVDGYAHVPDPNPEKIKASQGNMAIGENYYYGGLLRFDLSPKPAYNKLRELICERWHTETNIVTNEEGIADFRGFFGVYEILININGELIKKEIVLSKNSDNIFKIVI